MNHLPRTNEQFLNSEAVIGVFATLTPEDSVILREAIEQLGERPIILNIADLGWWTGIETSFLYATIGNSSKFYRRFTIPKSNGSLREIAEPLHTLKYVQRWILDNILNFCKVSAAARAYVKRRGIRRHLQLHSNQETVVSLDVKNFFQSVRYAKVKQAFSEMGYLEHVAAGLAHLCCLKGGLPQGVPTSAALSNIILLEFDEDMLRQSKLRHWRYSRYADDLAFSGAGQPDFVFSMVRDGLRRIKLKLNYSKSRVMTGTSRTISGIMLMNELKVKSKYKNEIYRAIYMIEKFGLPREASFQKKSTKETLRSLIGKIQYVGYIEKEIPAKMQLFLSRVNALPSP